MLKDLIQQKVNELSDSDSQSEFKEGMLHIFDTVLEYLDEYPILRKKELIHSLQLSINAARNKVKSGLPLTDWEVGDLVGTRQLIDNFMDNEIFLNKDYKDEQ